MNENLSLEQALLKLDSMGYTNIPTKTTVIIANEKMIKNHIFAVASHADR